MYINLKSNKHKIIYFNTTAMTSLRFIIVGTPPFLKEDRTFQKLSHLWGIRNLLLEKGDKPVKGG